ncbi:MAG: CapA family protein, partial [Anaerolineae bacterium]|nr:CapA family protein [Anaerolineae bacterium]
MCVACAACSRPTSAYAIIDSDYERLAVIDPQVFNLAFAGDVMLGRYVNKLLRRAPPGAVWGDTLPIFAAADARICNLECVLSDGGKPWTHTPKEFHFRSDAKNAAVLQAAHIDCVSIANNHVLDYDDDALREMLAVLDRARIAHAGAGTGREAWRPALVVRNDIRVGFLAFTDNEPIWAAQADRPGVCYLPVDVDDARAKALLARVAALREHVDCLIVSAHWGSNWGYTPPSAHRQLAHALIDRGADVIFGHSC